MQCECASLWQASYAAKKCCVINRTLARGISANTDLKEAASKTKYFKVETCIMKSTKSSLIYFQFIRKRLRRRGGM